MIRGLMDMNQIIFTAIGILLGVMFAFFMHKKWRGAQARQNRHETETDLPNQDEYADLPDEFLDDYEYYFGYADRVNHDISYSPYEPRNPDDLPAVESNYIC